MRVTTKAAKLLRAANLNEQWNLLGKQRKKYAAYLVKRYAYPVAIAIQQSYLFGYDMWPYDYRLKAAVMDTEWTL